jgi:hypothetical protein
MRTAVFWLAALCSLVSLPWRWRQHISLKRRWSSIRLHTSRRENFKSHLEMKPLGRRRSDRSVVWMLKKQDENVSTGFIWLGIRSRDGFFVCVNEASAFSKRGDEFHGCLSGCYFLNVDCTANWVRFTISQVTCYLNFFIVISRFI